MRADHLAIALPFSRNRASLGGALMDHNAFPREVMLEAIVRASRRACARPRPRDRRRAGSSARARPARPEAMGRRTRRVPTLIMAAVTPYLEGTR